MAGTKLPLGGHLVVSMTTVAMTIVTVTTAMTELDGKMSDVIVLRSWRI